MNHSDDLAGYDALLNEVHQVFLQENTLLKGGKLQEHTELMGRKSELMEKLDAMLKGLKDLRENRAHLNKERLRVLQDRIMQLLMLDRENEQLLLKQSVGSFHVSTPTKVSSQTLNKLYKSL